MEKCTRVSLTLTIQTAENLGVLSDYLGISRSALVEQVLSACTGDMLSAMATLPVELKSASEGDLRRFRGASRSIVQGRVDQLNTIISDIRREA
jgi:hypothetical protein